MTALPTMRARSLAHWLDSTELPGLGKPIDATCVSGGSQNEIFEIRRGPLHAALRIPPTAAPPGRDAGILREWRIIESLDGTDVPHTPALAMCSDAAVLGRPFYLMGFVNGWSPMDGTLPAPFVEEADARAELAYQLVDGIVAPW